jgi:hypothetical protein
MAPFGNEQYATFGSDRIDVGYLHQQHDRGLRKDRRVE